jgi:hypothetical protein
VGKGWLICVLRLKQAVAHPYLLENVMKQEFSQKDITWLIEKLKDIQTTTPFIHQVGRWCEQQLKIQKTPQDISGPEGEGFGAKFNLIPQLERVKNRARDETLEDLCRRCGSAPGDPFKPKVRPVLSLF